MTLIPEAALAQHIAVLGKTGSGKTFAIKGIVEGILASKKRVCIIDPTGAWWGLRSSHDGKGAGFPILILGGDHGDLPLPALGGAAVARLLVEQGASLVCDTSHLTVGERTRWFIDFGSTLYRANRAPLHLVIDEAHNFAPQGKVPDPDTGKMLHAANTLASGGRSRGIRLTMITQRPAKLHKDSLTCADTLIAMRVLAPQDRQAVKDWIDGCGDVVQGREVLDSLANLQRGEGWAWYPEGRFLKRMKFPAIKTFDSSATPTDGHELTQPKAAAEIDMTEIKAALADAVREAEANDPKILRKRIAELEKQKAAPAGHSRSDLDAEYMRGREDGFDAGRSKELQRVRFLTTDALAHLNALSIFTTALVEPQGTISNGPRTENPRDGMQPSPAPGGASRPGRAARPSTARQIDGAGSDLSKAERLALTALAQYPKGRSAVQIAVITGYAVNGGGFRNALGALRTKGFITGGGDLMLATDAGIAALGAFDPLPSGDELLQHWYRQLGKAERKVLEALAEVYPSTLSVAQIANRSGYEMNGGGFRNALGRLRTLELIKGRAEISASEDLFS